MTEHFVAAFTPRLLLLAMGRAIKKLSPWQLWRNPVMLITELGAIITSIEAFIFYDEFHAFTLHVSAWLWFTVLFANFAEAIAESRNKAQADSLRSTRVETTANLVLERGEIKKINARDLKKGDIVHVGTGEVIPGDGEIIHGMASIDESHVTGESEPVIRASGTDQNAVTGGTTVVSDEIQVRITADPGQSFLEKMIKLIESAKRKKTPNEIALIILLSGLTFVFIAMIFSLAIFGEYYHIRISIAMQTALLISLIPTTIAGLLSSIGIAGINRLMKKNVLAMSGSAIEAAGDIDTILMDKTGTITMGNRRAYELTPASETVKEEFFKACLLTSLMDETIEGRSIIEFLEKNHPSTTRWHHQDMVFVPFSAMTRMSGVDIHQEQREERYRKGAKDTIEKFVGAPLPPSVDKVIRNTSEKGGTPLVVASQKQILGVVSLKDTIKPGLSDQFDRFRKMGIKTMMMTGDNAMVAATIAKEVGVDGFFAEVNPKEKVQHLVTLQEKGQLVAMTGDGVNDAPALAQADVGVAMNSGTQAAKEAANMIDLDSNPTKLFEVIEIGKQMLMTRGALTTFSVANDVAKYFAVLPAMLIPYFPFFETLNIMHLSTPESAILSAVIFNALIIIALIPLALRGVTLTTASAVRILNKNLLLYGMGGVFLPFLGIKSIDMFLVLLRLN